MRVMSRVFCCFLCLTIPMMGQGKRLWVLSSTGEMKEYDPATFAAKQTVKGPAEAALSPQNISVNHLGEILFVPSVSLPLSEEDVTSVKKVWFWNGHEATTLDQGLKRESAATGSNQAITETAPSAFLSADGGHLFWLANRARRLEREELDLSITTTWQAWRTDESGGAKEDLATVKIPECACPSGTCEESCPAGEAWAPEGGVADFLLMSQVVAAKTGPAYKASTRLHQDAGRWTTDLMPEPLQRVLDAASTGNVIVEAIPDTSCCGSSNQSDDQTLVLSNGKKLVVFDEFATYKNADYDISFYTSNARLAADLKSVAMTIVATATANQPIQLAEQGQASPEESKQIRRALAELPAVEVKSIEDLPRRIAFVPHAILVGWISEKELLIVEDHLLVAYNVSTGARRKSTVRVNEVARVFLR
jgi:hypothetical protein